MKIERLVTERLILRTYEERDLQDLYEYLSDDKILFEWKVMHVHCSFEPESRNDT